MDIVNSTPLPAKVSLTPIEGDTARAGLLVAKATFRFDDSGNVELDAATPYPILESDQESDLGILPQDFEPRPEGSFEVILLGEAHSPQGIPRTHCSVGLQVGPYVQQMWVHGDRNWRGNEPGVTEPFIKMPLTYEKAFGGTAEVWLDERSPIDVSDDLNPLGKGFDPSSKIALLGKSMQAPPGFPRLLSPERPMANLEDPRTPVQRPSDAPLPYCWATMPRSIGFAALEEMRLGHQLAETNPSDPLATAPPHPGSLEHASVFARAHPEWRIPIPKPNSQIIMSGLTPGGAVQIPFPAMSVAGDYIVGERKGSLAVLPSTLLLLPSESCFCITYRALFNVAKKPDDEACFRMRIEQAPRVFSGSPN